MNPIPPQFNPQSKAANALGQILVIDDDPQSLESTARILELSGYFVATKSDAVSALELIRSRAFDLVVSDIRMPKMTGLEFLKALELVRPGTSVILMTAFGQIDQAVWAMKNGAVDFLTKPFKRQELLSAIEKALSQKQMVRQNPSLDQTWLGSSQVMQKLREDCQRVASTQATILLQGESGTGKEWVAKWIHQNSSKKNGPWVVLNCAALPQNLIESELFGYEKGAFSGAETSKQGLFEAAHHGTLLLDEIGDMPMEAQTKLLRILQNQEVRRVGSTRTTIVDVRVIAATHQDLKQRVKQGLFREDLLYRLSVVGLTVPSVRERMADLDQIIEYFLSMIAHRHGKPNLRVEQEVLNRWKSHAWPGNLRELSHTIERAVIFSAGDVIEDSHLPEVKSEDMPNKVGGTLEFRVGTPLKEIEEMMIKKTLEATLGDKNMTAKLLGIHARTISRRLEGEN